MNRRMIIMAACLALIGAAGAYATGEYDYSGERISGSGFVRSEDRSVPRFTGIDVEGSGTVTLAQGPVQSVTVETDDNVLRVVKTEVVDGVLHLGFERGVSVTRLTRLEFRITAPAIDQLVISGSGNVRGRTPLRAQSLALSIRGSGSIDVTVDTDILHTDIGGSGDIVVDGTTTQLMLGIDGSGSVRARNLASGSADVHINGSGSADVTASDAIAISINGSGSVSYGGGARATVHSSGSGTAKQR